MTDAGQRAGIYCRMSLAVMNDPAKVEDQARISRELAARIGWRVAEDAGHPAPGGVYTDNNRSAWQKHRRRPAWDRMLADVDAGRITAIIVYHGDRLVRQPSDLEALINLADGRGVRLAAPTGTRDLDSADDRFVLRILAAQACMESDNTSRRRKAQYERWRREGRVRAGGRGGRAFGFAADGVTHVGAECDAVRAAARAILEGASVRAAAAAAALPATTGRPIDDSTLRKMLQRPRYAGLMPDGASRAAWEPVLDRDTWDVLQAVLATRAAHCPRPSNGRRHLLSGVAVCGTCGQPLQARQSKGRAGRPPSAGYGCVSAGCPRRVYRSRQLLDAYVTGAAVAALSDQAYLRAVVPPVTGHAAEARRLEARRAETEAVLADLAGHPGRSAAVLARALESFDRRLERLRAAGGDGARARLLGAHAGTTRDGFGGLPLATRRALVAALFTVTVRPASRRGPGFRPEDVGLYRPR